jgi:hypothetical protein
MARTAPTATLLKLRPADELLPGRTGSVLVVGGENNQTLGMVLDSCEIGDFGHALTVDPTLA